MNPCVDMDEEMKAYAMDLGRTLLVYDCRVRGFAMFSVQHGIDALNAYRMSHAFAEFNERLDAAGYKAPETLSPEEAIFQRWSQAEIDMLAEACDENHVSLDCPYGILRPLRKLNSGNIHWGEKTDQELKDLMQQRYVYVDNRDVDPAPCDVVSWGDQLKRLLPLAENPFFRMYCVDMWGSVLHGRIHVNQRVFGGAGQHAPVYTEVSVRVSDTGEQIGRTVAVFEP